MKTFVTILLILSLLPVNAQQIIETSHPQSISSDLRMQGAGESLIFGGTTVGLGVVLNLTGEILIKEPKSWSYSDLDSYKRDLRRFRDNRTTVRIVSTGISLIGLCAVVSAGIKLSKDNSRVSAKIGADGIGLSYSMR